jgi:hypothetical protein
MNVGGQEFEFMPELTLPPGSGCEVQIEMPSGKAHVIIRCLVTHKLLEHRCECQVLEDGEKKIIVAAPGSIERPKLSWKIRLLRWLAKG